MTTVINGAEGLNSILDGIGQVVTSIDYRSPLEEGQQAIARNEAVAFAGQREPGGQPWAALKPSTVKRKGQSRILFESGALMESLVTIGGPGNINTVSSRELLFGTNIGYSIFHDAGTSRMPARPHVGMNETTLDTVVDLIADAVVEQLKPAGGV